MPIASSSEPVPPRRQAALLAALATVVYLGLAAYLFAQIRLVNHGHFTYALDDPYIHLALSDGIAHGHYGINPGEPASPSSSLLWPFLLAPFAALRAQAMVPLILNLLAGILTAILIGSSVARWPWAQGTQEQQPAEAWRRRLSAVALVFLANLLGLTFTGMEHVLQVLLAGAGAWGIIDSLRGRPIPLWVLAAVALGPSVRYENVGITVAVAIALLGQRRAGRAAAVLVAGITPLTLFSLFLHHLGLPWLPTSVIVKGRVPGAKSVESHGILLILSNLEDTLSNPQRLLVLILFASLAGLALRERHRVRRFALGGAAIATGLHLAIGRFDWFHRYEVYIVFFAALVLLHVLHERPMPSGWYALGLLGCCFSYVQAFHDVPISANQVYRQQYQTHRLLQDFYTGNIAVNDLGLVSYHRPPGTYVLDLWGLASVEAAEQKHRTTAWMDATTRQHHVGLVAIYPLWFPPAPADWTFLGELCENDAPLALGSPCITYYATPEAALPELQDEFRDFLWQLPTGISLYLPGKLPIYR